MTWLIITVLNITIFIIDHIDRLIVVIDVNIQIRQIIIDISTFSVPNKLPIVRR